MRPLALATSPVPREGSPSRSVDEEEEEARAQMLALAERHMLEEVARRSRLTPASVYEAKAARLRAMLQAEDQAVASLWTPLEARVGLAMLKGKLKPKEVVAAWDKKGKGCVARVDVRLGISGSLGIKGETKAVRWRDSNARARPTHQLSRRVASESWRQVDAYFDALCNAGGADRPINRDALGVEKLRAALVRAKEVATELQAHQAYVAEAQAERKERLARLQRVAEATSAALRAAAKHERATGAAAGAADHIESGAQGYASSSMSCGCLEPGEDAPDCASSQPPARRPTTTPTPPSSNRTAAVQVAASSAVALGVETSPGGLRAAVLTRLEREALRLQAAYAQEEAEERRREAEASAIAEAQERERAMREAAARRAAKEAAAIAQFELQPSSALEEQAKKLAAFIKSLHATANTHSIEQQVGRALIEKRLKPKHLVAEWDAKRKGEISKKDFRTGVRKALAIKAEDKEIDGLFASFDADGGGTLDLPELQAALVRLQEAVEAAGKGQRAIVLKQAKLREHEPLLLDAIARTAEAEAAAAAHPDGARLMLPRENGGGGGGGDGGNASASAVVHLRRDAAVAQMALVDHQRALIEALAQAEEDEERQQQQQQQQRTSVRMPKSKGAWKTVQTSLEDGSLKQQADADVAAVIEPPSERLPPAASSELPVYPKSEAGRALLIAGCKKSALFRGCSHELISSAVSAMQPVEGLAVGRDVVTQGDTKGDSFYVVESGEFTVHLKQAKDAEVHRYYPGSTFGELALMYSCPRAATIRCAVEGLLWSIDRKTYRLVVRMGADGALGGEGSAGPAPLPSRSPPPPDRPAGSAGVLTRAGQQQQPPPLPQPQQKPQQQQSPAAVRANGFSKPSSGSGSGSGGPLRSSAELHAKAEDLLDEASVCDVAAKEVQDTTLQRKLGRALASRIGNGSKEAVRKLLREFDQNGDGLLQRVEMRQMVRNHLKIAADNAEIDALFREMDEDNSGEVDLDEFILACHALREAATQANEESEQARERAAKLRTQAASYCEAAAKTAELEAEQARVHESLRAPSVPFGMRLGAALLLKARVGDASGGADGIRRTVGRDGAAMSSTDLLNHWSARFKQEVIKRADWQRLIGELELTLTEEAADFFAKHATSRGGIGIAPELNLRALAKLCVDYVQAAEKNERDASMALAVPLMEEARMLQERCLEMDSKIANEYCDDLLLL